MGITWGLCRSSQGLVIVQPMLHLVSLRHSRNACSSRQPLVCVFSVCVCVSPYVCAIVTRSGPADEWWEGWRNIITNGLAYGDHGHTLPPPSYEHQKSACAARARPQPHWSETQFPVYRVEASSEQAIWQSLSDPDLRTRSHLQLEQWGFVWPSLIGT